MTFRFDALIYLALGSLVAIVVVAAFLVGRTDDKPVSLEIRKVRFAAATFTGIMLLFVFSAALYFAGATTDPKDIVYTCPCTPPSPGKDIFDKGLTAMFTLAGSIIGYLFGTNKSPRPPAPPKLPSVSGE
jgi:hypothetical protein